MWEALRRRPLWLQGALWIVAFPVMVSWWIWRQRAWRAWVRVVGISLVVIVTLGVIGSFGSPRHTSSTTSLGTSSPSSTTEPPASPSVVTSSTTPKKRHHHKHRQAKKPRPHKQHRPTMGSPAAACPSPSRTLAGVYHPSRLVVLASCRYAAGAVMDVRQEVDGDIHVIVRLDSAYRRMLNADNYSQQHGGLVVEFMARDGGHLPEPSIGARLALVGAWVLDTDHGWRELHPVFWLKMLGRVYRSGPQFGGSPAGDYSSTAANDCRTQTGKRCVGYGGGASGGEGGSGSRSGGGGGCTPGYSPCLTDHGGADYDCYGGGGNGPYYTAPGVTYTVTGSDPYNLDGNGDGSACG